jgi:hypothetical protein
MKGNLESIKEQFKKDTIKAVQERAKSLIKSEDLTNLGDTNFFSYVTGYTDEELGARVDIIMQAFPDEFFEQSFYKTRYNTSLLVAEELMKSHYNIRDDNEFLEFLHELMDKIVELFKESILEQIIKEPVKPIERVYKGFNSEVMRAQLDKVGNNAEAKREIALRSRNYLSSLIRKGDLLHLDDMERGDPKERLAHMNEYLMVYGTSLSAGLNDVVEFAEQNVDRKALQLATRKLEVIVMNGKEGDVVQPNGLTKRQEIALRLLSKAKDGLIDEEKRFLQGFVKGSIGNVRLNRILVGLSARGMQLPDGISNEVITDMRDFTYNTRDIDMFLGAGEKFKRNYEKIERGEDLDPNDKVTLREYGILTSFAKTKDKFFELAKFGILQGDAELEKIQVSVDWYAPIISEVNKRIIGEIEYQAGDIAMQSLSKEIEVRNKSLGLQDELARLFVSEHMHTVKLFVDDTTSRKMVSHMTGSKNVITGEFEIIGYLYSDVYKIKIEKLVNEKFGTRLQGVYGDDYVKKINEMYRDIEFNVHKNAEEKFRNSRYRVGLGAINAGIADFLPFFGHNKVNPDDLDKLHERMTKDIAVQDEMICSEFAARTTAAAFIELNKMLQKVLDTTENVIDIPFDARERFSKIHPDRLLQILGAKGCIEQAPRTKTEDQFISFAEKITASKDTSREVSR